MVIHGIGKQYFKAIAFFGEKLNLPNDVILEFSYSKDLGENVLGHCWESEDSIFSRVPIYCVQLRTKQDKKEILETIAHVPVKGEPWEIEAEDFAISVCQQLEKYGR